LRYKTQRLNLPLVHNWGAGHPFCALAFAAIPAQAQTTACVPSSSGPACLGKLCGQIGNTMMDSDDKNIIACLACPSTDPGCTYNPQWKSMQGAASAGCPQQLIIPSFQCGIYASGYAYGRTQYAPAYFSYTAPATGNNGTQATSFQCGWPASCSRGSCAELPTYTVYMICGSGTWYCSISSSGTQTVAYGIGQTQYYSGSGTPIYPCNAINWGGYANTD
jgi:hypothetical protein